MSRRFLALDTEDDSNGQVYMINFFDGMHHRTFVRDEVRHPEFKDQDKFRAPVWNWLYQQSDWTDMVWACNAEYDLINLFGAEWVGLMTTMYYVSSGLMRANCQDVKMVFYDTLRHWPMTVAQMGLYLGIPKMEADFKSVEYCRRDTEIVWHFTNEMLTRYDELGLSIKATLPSMAMQLFMKKFYRKPFKALPIGVVDRMRRGYYGGRVEVYRFGEIPGPINHYDVNSLFPSVMVSGTFPNVATYTMKSSPDLAREGMAEVTIRLPQTEYPSLPMKGDADMVYAYGTLRGSWCYPELRQALADGATIEKSHLAVEFDPMPTPFEEYIRYCYGKRLDSKAGTLDDVLWKLYMNSLYGKFGQRPELHYIYQNEDRIMTPEPSPAANVIWAAYVTCLARLSLLSFLRQTSECYYTDTDSVFTPDTLPTDKKLGALKLEGTYTAMDVQGNKVYSVEQTTPGRDFIETAPGVYRKFKAKGVKREAAADFIRTGRATFRKPIRFRESRRTLGVANMWVEMEKVKQAVYTKRIVHADGTTEPWEWLEYCREIGVQ
jgi:hypothetical protein